MGELYREIDNQFLGRDFAWLDTGKMDSLVEAAESVQMLGRRQGAIVLLFKRWHSVWLDIRRKAS